METRPKRQRPHQHHHHHHHHRFLVLCCQMSIISFYTIPSSRFLQANCLRPFLAAQSGMVYLWQEADTIPDCIIRQTPWPCKLCGNEPFHTVWHYRFLGETRVCNDCHEKLYSRLDAEMAKAKKRKSSRLAEHATADENEAKPVESRRLWPGTKSLKVSDTNAYPKSKNVGVHCVINKHCVAGGQPVSLFLVLVTCCLMHRGQRLPATNGKTMHHPCSCSCSTSLSFSCSFSFSLFIFI